MLTVHVEAVSNDHSYRISSGLSIVFVKSVSDFLSTLVSNQHIELSGYDIPDSLQEPLGRGILLIKINSEGNRDRC